MLKKISKLLVVVITFFTFLIQVNAASLSISSNYRSIVIGGSINITVKADGLAGKFSITSSNGNVLSGGTSSVWLENETKTYKFSAKNIGSATITVTPIDVSDSNGNVYKNSKSVTVNVVKPREKSNNNNLKKLEVVGYSLSPEFNKDTLEYTVNLESNIEKITINASEEDGYASLSGSGEKEVQEGDNKFEITVTSETGKSKVYTVNAVVKDSNPIVKKINGNNYTVVKRESALTKPDSFVATVVNINDIEVPAFYNETTNITLLGLKDENGSIYLYKYDAKTDYLTKYETLSSSSKTIIFEDSNDDVEGFIKTKVVIDDNEYSAYQHESNKNYILIYGADLQTAVKNWYLYNVKDKSIQVYMSDIINNIEDDFNKIIEEYKVVILGMSGLSLLLLLIVVIQIVSKNKMKKKLLKKMQVLKDSLEVKKIEEEKDAEKDNSKKLDNKSEKKSTKNKKKK